MQQAKGEKSPCFLPSTGLFSDHFNTGFWRQKEETSPTAAVKYRQQPGPAPHTDAPHTALPIAGAGATVG